MTASTGDPAATTSGRNSPTEDQGDIPVNTFAARLVLARHHAGHLSIREAADRCGLGRGAWTNWERGARPYDEPEVARKISEGLGVDFMWLLLGGPLLSARGKPTRRSGPVTGGYRKVADWASSGGPITRPGDTSSARPARRPRLIERARLAAA